MRGLRLLGTVLVLAISALIAVPSGATATSTVTAPPAPAPAAWTGAVPNGTDTTVALQYGGSTRSYVLFSPANTPSGPRPLIVALHYLNGTSSTMEFWSNLDAGAGSLGDYVVYPQGVANSWNAGSCCGAARDQGVDDVGFLNAVINDVESRVSIDPDRVSMGGFSNGAIMAYRYACSGSTQVSSYFIGSGVNASSSCQFAPGLKFLQINGLQDQAIKYWGSQTNTDFTGGIQPSVPSTFTTQESLLGCSGYTKTALSSVLTRLTATNCADGAGSVLLVSSLLDHRWVNGTQAVATYGIDETGTLWSWLLWSVWAKAD